MNNQSITLHYYLQHIYFQATHLDYQVYLVSRVHLYLPNSKALINCKTFNMISSDTFFSTYIFGLKWCNNIHPVMHMEYKIGCITSPKCPTFCGCQDKDYMHLLYCISPAQMECQTILSANINATCDKHHIDPSLRRVLLNMPLIFPIMPVPISLSTTYQLLNNQQMALPLDLSSTVTSPNNDILTNGNIYNYTTYPTTKTKIEWYCFFRQITNLPYLNNMDNLQPTSIST